MQIRVNNYKCTYIMKRSIDNEGGRKNSLNPDLDD